jgi:hypothetical protein
METTTFESSPTRNRAGTRARVAAVVVEASGWLVLVGGLVGGVSLVANASSYVNVNQARQVGAGMAIGSLILGSWIIMMGAYIQSRTKRHK